MIDTKKPPNVEREDSVLTSKKIIQNHNSTKNSFSSLYIRSNVKYKDENNSQNVSAEIKIKKDEKILIIIRFLGITMAKALITPTEVKYYEKINGTYFEGNFQSLSQWLGTDLDFNKIQNMLLGQPIINVTIGNYSFTTVEELYKLNAIEDKINTSFYFEKEHFFLKKQEFSEPEKARSFEISYPSFQKAAFAVLPTSLLIKAVQAKGTTTIAVDYNSVTFNEDLPFSYSVPDGYDRIFINLNDQNK
ncbi:DUF4292 domain-containing protein [Flavobacterium sp.]|uniref:DUF4292 domain-containing protein n=1 Tax=Flavobacterium sp. TaxID=239 RepID=UPI0025E87905|nr:DUF4292 domain-containing protein [Flavobacterium sp.]